MRPLLIGFLLLSSVNCFGRKIKPVPIPNSPNTTYLPSLQKETNICIGLKLNLGPKSVLDNQICQYYSDHYSDAGIVFPYPLVYSVDVDYQVFREYPLDQFTLNRNSLSIKELIYYTADGKVIANGIPVLGQCGWDDELPRRVVVGANASINIDPNYFVKADFKPIPSEVPAGFTCIVTRLRYDVSENLVRLVDKVVSSGCNQINSMIQTKSNFKNEANTIWNFLNSPIKLNDDKFLEFNPKSFSMSELNFIDAGSVSVNTTLGLKFNPKVVNNPVSNATPLPKLNIGTCTPNFEIEYDLESKVNDFNKSPVIVDKSIYNRKFDIGCRRLLINDIDFYYSGNSLVAKVNVRTRAIKSHVHRRFSREFIYFFERIFYRRKGDIYLLASLKNDKNAIQVNKINFDSSSLFEINRKAKWILSSDILSYLQESLAIDQKYEILNLQSQFQHYLNKELSNTVQLTFSDSNPEVNEIFFFNDKVISRYRLRGKPTITIDIK